MPSFPHLVEIYLVLEKYRQTLDNSELATEVIPQKFVSLKLFKLSYISISLK